MEQLNFKPAPDVWSIAQNIDHLIVINQTYYPLIKEAKENTLKLPWHGKVKFLVNWFGRMILSSVAPDRRRKMKTFSIWLPGTSQVGPEILSRFEQHQQTLKGLIADSDDLLAKKTVIYSPANQAIVYTLETAFDIIVTHERRHLEQAKELKANFIRK
jgi:hypothetical protein